MDQNALHASAIVDSTEADTKTLMSEIVQGLLMAHARLDIMEERLAAAAATAAAGAVKENIESGIDGLKQTTKQIQQSSAGILDQMRTNSRESISAFHDSTSSMQKTSADILEQMRTNSLKAVSLLRDATSSIQNASDAIKDEVKQGVSSILNGSQDSTKSIKADVSTARSDIAEVRTELKALERQISTVIHVRNNELRDQIDKLGVALSTLQNHRASELMNTSNKNAERASELMNTSNKNAEREAGRHVVVHLMQNAVTICCFLTLFAALWSDRSKSKSLLPLAAENWSVATVCFGVLLLGLVVAVPIIAWKWKQQIKAAGR